MKKILVTALFALFIAGLVCIPLQLRVQPADAQAGNQLRVTTSTGTARAVKQSEGYGVQAVHIEWTSTAGGAYTAILDNCYGQVVRCAFAPVAAASPTASYDVVLTDLTLNDVLEGEGANQSATAAADAVPLIAETISSTTTHNAVYVSGRLTLSITAAGAAKQGEFTVYIKH